MKSQKGKCAQGHTARKSSPGQGSSSDSLTPGLLLVTTVIETCNAGASPHLGLSSKPQPAGSPHLAFPPRPERGGSFLAGEIATMFSSRAEPLRGGLGVSGVLLG